MLAPQVVETLVHGQPIKPGTQARFPPEAAQFPVRVYENVLEQVFGVLGRSGHAGQQAEEAPRMGAVQKLEGRRVAVAAPVRQLEVVGSASNGLDALELFCKTDPDVVTMDITMPHMDGIECVERIVAIKPNILILVISALADKATAVEAMEKGANGFLNKPFSDRQLNDALEELLGSA